LRGGTRFGRGGAKVVIGDKRHKVPGAAARTSTSTITRKPIGLPSLVFVVVRVFRVNQIEDEHENDNEEESGELR
jgi:hypothetical protein